MSGTLHGDLRYALRARLQAFQPFAVTGSLETTAPGTVRGDGLETFLPGDEVLLSGFNPSINGYAVVLTSDVGVIVVRKTLTTQSAAGGRSVVLGLPETCLWEGFKGDIPVDRACVRDRLGPQNAPARSLGSDTMPKLVRHTGLYFVDVFYPFGFGPGAAERYAGYLLHQAFYPGLRLTAPSGQRLVIRSSERAVAQYTATHVMIPCTIAWWADTLTP